MRYNSSVVTVGLFILAGILLLGTFGLLFVGRQVPEFIVGFDGVVVYAAFSHGAFLGLTQATQNAQAVSGQIVTQYHELAKLGMTTTSPATITQTEPTTGGTDT